MTARIKFILSFIALCCVDSAGAFSTCGLVGFADDRSLSLQPRRRGRADGICSNSFAYLELSSDDNINDTGGNSEDSDESRYPMEVEPTDRKSKKVAAGVFEIGTSFLSIIFTGFGAAFTLGLLLNLNGYGYSISAQEGLRIDTLDEMRMERQLNIVSSGDKPAATKQSISTVVAEFFTRQPFTASLVVTAAALLYEEVVKASRAKSPKDSDEDGSNRPDKSS